MPALIEKPIVSYTHLISCLRPRRVHRGPEFRRAYRQLCDALVWRCGTVDASQLRALPEAAVLATEEGGPLCFALFEVISERLASEQLDEDLRSQLEANVAAFFPQWAG